MRSSPPYDSTEVATNGSAERQSRSWRVVTAMIVAGCLGLGLSVWAIWHSLQTAGPRPMFTAKEFVARLVAEPNGAQRLEIARQAESILRNTAQRPNDAVGDTQDALVLLAGVQRWQGRRQAATHLLSMTSLSRCSADNLADSALLFFIGGDPEIADRLLKLAQRRDAHRRNVQRASAMIAYELGRDEEALQWCREWSEQDPQNAEPWRLILQVYEDRGHTHLAVDASREFLRRKPDREGEVMRKLIRHLIRLGDAAEARRLLNESVREFDPVRLPWEWQLLVALVEHLEGHAQVALDQVRALLVERPQQPELLNSLGQFLLSASDARGAIEALEQCGRLRPIDSDVQYLLGQAYARDGQSELAEKHLQLHRQLRDAQVQINTLERLAGLHPQDRETRLTLSNLYDSLGLQDQAQMWRAAANLIPK